MKSPKSNITHQEIVKKIARYQRTALMLQGGGALGAYQVGVYRALAQIDCHPDWVCGISIGAINGAIIAGNPPEKRVAQLEAFWSLITSGLPDLFDFTALMSESVRVLSNSASAMATTLTGAPGFFKPRLINPWLMPSGNPGNPLATSYYDSAALRETLLRFVDFDLLNSGKIRLSVGAVNVATGNGIYFDTAKERLTPEHIMASGALPPALPMVKIADDYYWDGGIVSNTPLQYLMEDDSDLSTLVFQVDLFRSQGKVPTQMSELLDRQKEITYASRTRLASNVYKRVLGLRHQLASALSRVPKNKLLPGEAQLLANYQDLGLVNLIQLIYQSKASEGANKDYEFSTPSMREHQEAGYRDMIDTLQHADWFDMPSVDEGIIDHDIHRLRSRKAII